MIKLENVSKWYDDKRVLNSIDLEINEKDIIGIIGPSGCGKSTLLRCMNLLIRPEKGKVSFENKNLLTLKEKELNKVRTQIGMVFQQFNLINHMTVIENITFAPIKLGILTEEQALKDAEGYLKNIGLIDKKNEYPKNLSGGEQQRVAIIRTLMMKPKVILFDEPTSALDPTMVGEVSNLIKKIANNGMTMVLVSHEMHFIKNIANRVIYMEKGKIVEEGSAKEIFENPHHEGLKTFLSKINNK